MIKAIETVYRGYRFRSRLEARWAVFFDALGIRWEYEAEGFDLDGVWYLPDFWLPAQQCFFEVKGTKPTDEENEKMSRLAELSGFTVYCWVGQIPLQDNPHGFGLSSEDGNDGYVFSACGGADNHQWWCECPDCGQLGIEFEGRSDRLPCKHPPGCPTHGHNGDKGYNWDTPRLQAAYTAARQARFDGARP